MKKTAAEGTGGYSTLSPRSEYMKRTEIKRGGFGSTAKVRSEQSKRNDSDDDQFRKVVKARAGGWCQRCGQPGEEAHHLFEKGSSRFSHLRHDDRNGIFLCVPCHRAAPYSAHSDRVAFRVWWASEDETFAALFAEVTHA